MSNLVRMLIKVCVIINCAFNYSLIMFQLFKERRMFIPLTQLNDLVLHKFSYNCTCISVDTEHLLSVREVVGLIPFGDSIFFCPTLMSCLSEFTFHSELCILSEIWIHVTSS